MAGELNPLAIAVKGAGEADLNREATKKNILNRRSQSSQRGIAATKFIEQEVTELTENLSPLAPVQLSVSRGRDALSGALAQRAGPGANPRGKTRIGTSVVQRSREQEYGLEAATQKPDFWPLHQRGITPGEFRKKT
jgi:hypothetical protein